MKNELLTIGPFTVYGYGLMIALGVVAGYLLGEYRARKNGLDADVIFGFVGWVVFGGLVGAKLLYLLTQLRAILANPQILRSVVVDGFVVYGGLIGGIFTALIYSKIKKISFFRYLDLLTPSVALGQTFGRIGCFLAGCCYGKETDSILGVVFQDSAFAPNHVKLLPTQLFSSGLDLLHMFFLLWFSQRKEGDGQVLGMYLTLYSVGRFCLEFFRGDVDRGHIGILSTSQFIALFTFAAGIALLVARRGKWDAGEAAVSAKEE